MSKSRFSNNINIKNRKASFNYEWIENFVAGLVLKGSEIKSIREGKANLNDGYCFLNDGEMYAKGIHISPYAEQGIHFNHEPERERKLLLKKSELRKLETKIKEKGLTLVPVRLFINERGFAKLEIALARGKKTFDKRQSIKEKDVKRELSRIKLR